MKGIFLYYKTIDYDNLTGIDKKVLWQIDTLSTNGNSCELLTINNSRNRRSIEKIDQFLSLLPFTNRYPKWKYLNEFSDADFIYLRRPTCFTTHTIKILKNIKEKNPRCLIILEIPTYPYDEEMKVKWIYYPLYIKDKYNRRKLKKYVDVIAVQNDVNEIFGIPTVRFSNGIKVDEISIRKPTIMNNDEIYMCAIATLNPWQGYERIIQGMHKYYDEGGSRKVSLHIVGDGSELQYYKKLTQQLNLHDRVFFHGRLYGEKLDEIYNCADLGLDAFGRYKTDNSISTSLKSREYLAKGLPIVSGCKVDILDSESPYYLEFKGDSSPIDINRIIEFYDDIYKSGLRKVEVSEKIRNYAYNVCDVSKTMEQINRFINNK